MPRIIGETLHAFPMIDAVLFDLDGTLLDRVASLECFLFTQQERFSALRHIPRADYASRFVELDAHGRVWKDSVYQTLVSEFRITGQSWQELLEDYETTFCQSCVPFPEVLTTLGALQADGYRLGVISNGRSAFQRRVVRALGIEHFFTAILISETEGIRKPEPEIFLRALERLRVLPQRSVFVGDHPVADIGGARHAGMKAVWLRNEVWPPPESVEATIDALDELPLVISALA